MGKRLHINYKEEISKHRLENIISIRRELMTLNETSPLNEKLENYSERYNISKAYLLDSLENEYDDSLLYGFEKDPLKQNLAEKLQLDFIMKLPFITNVKKLPPSKKGGLVIKDGEVSGNVETKDIKTIDFYWEYILDASHKLKFYATCKYTNEEGGAQDNQFKDVIAFHGEASKVKDKNSVFYSITDGDYYHKDFKGKTQDNNTVYKDRIDYLNKEICNGDRNKATDTDKILWDITDDIISWIKGLADIDINIRDKKINEINKVMEDYIQPEYYSKSDN